MKLRLISEGEHKDAFGTHKWKTYAQIPTNADRIRAMTDEELAKWRSDGQCPSKRFQGDYDCTSFTSCRLCWLDWLKEEVDE